MTNAGSKPRALVVTAGLAVEVPNVDFFAYELVKKSTFIRPSSHILLQHPAPIPCVIAIDRRVWLACAPACLPFVQRDDALPSGMRRIDAAIRRDMRDRLDSRGNLHLRPQDRLRGRNSDLGMPALCRPSIAWWIHLTTKRPGRREGTANPISSSLAYSCVKISAAAITLSKIALLAQAKQPRLSATLVRNKTPARRNCG
jgi:hypothetical protein